MLNIHQDKAKLMTKTTDDIVGVGKGNMEALVLPVFVLPLPLLTYM